MLSNPRAARRLQEMKPANTWRGDTAILYHNGASMLPGACPCVVLVLSLQLTLSGAVAVLVPPLLTCLWRGAVCVCAAVCVLL